MGVLVGMIVGAVVMLDVDVGGMGVTVGGGGTGVWVGRGGGCVAVGNAMRVAATAWATRVCTALSSGVAGGDSPAMQDINSIGKTTKRDRTYFLRILTPPKRPSGDICLFQHITLYYT